MTEYGNMTEEEYEKLYLEIIKRSNEVHKKTMEQPIVYTPLSEEFIKMLKEED